LNRNISKSVLPHRNLTGDIIAVHHNALDGTNRVSGLQASDPSGSLSEIATNLFVNVWATVRTSCKNTSLARTPRQDSDVESKKGGRCQGQ
jgi:hypothetical protein